MRAVICLLLGIFALANGAHTTVGVWNIAGDPSRVAVNFLSNHDYYPRSWPYAFRAQAAVLEAVRRDLVLQGKLEDEPIVVRLPGAGFNGTPKGTRLFWKVAGVQLGDSEGILSRRRYIIEWNEEKRPKPDTPEFFDGLLLLTLHLQKLNAQNTELEIENLSNMRAKSRNIRN